MFAKPEEKKDDLIIYLSHKELIIKMTIAMISLGIMTFSFRIMYDHYRHTIFEDIYGRGLIFFLCASIHYLRTKDQRQGNIHVFTLVYFR